jgi:hypothetical protein
MRFAIALMSETEIGENEERVFGDFTGGWRFGETLEAEVAVHRDEFGDRRMGTCALGLRSERVTVRISRR